MRKGCITHFEIVAEAESKLMLGICDPPLSKADGGLLSGCELAKVREQRPWPVTLKKRLITFAEVPETPTPGAPSLVTETTTRFPSCVAKVSFAVPSVPGIASPGDR